MKTAFSEFVHPGEDGLRDLWQQATIAVDANVLLNLYRYSETLREEMLQSLERVQAQLWLPHQAGLEFFRDRPGVMAKQVQVIEKASSDLRTAKETLWGLYRAPIREREDRQNRLNEAFDVLNSYLKSAREAVIEPTTDPAKDRVLEAVAKLFEGRVGTSYGDARIAEIQTEGEARFAASVPPGFKDAGKGGSRQYGDLVMWMQLIDQAKVTSRPIVFVTDEDKEDWWLAEGQWTLGPRPELIAEMGRASGQRFHMYKPPAFMKQVGQASEASIAEAEALPAQQRPTESPAGAAPAGSSLDFVEDLRHRALVTSESAEQQIAILTEALETATPDRTPILRSRLRFQQQRIERAMNDLLQIERTQIELSQPRLGTHPVRRWISVPTITNLGEVLPPEAAAVDEEDDAEPPEDESEVS